MQGLYSRSEELIKRARKMGHTKEHNRRLCFENQNNSPLYHEALATDKHTLTSNEQIDFFPFPVLSFFLVFLHQNPTLNIKSY
ncbi:hypothetical protein CKAN_01962900 [Cinnamomum micranthum f. kanehirae]|uniref:Uncharacterized protein n=1 Tax=Cinnamomum micranthum f. kanehirae TaxID=337451 RepID=A0A3S3PH64_9MAGN|nr:hypothetical protein CKAN_01962900 [Cinnamomum micranthum f. kanehirae]